MKTGSKAAILIGGLAVIGAGAILANGGSSKLASAVDRVAVAFRPKDKGPTDPQGYYREPPRPWRWTPRVTGPYDYPLDTDGSLRFTRPKTGIDVFSAPWIEQTADATATYRLGITPICRMNDAIAISIAAVPPAPQSMYPATNPYAFSYGTMIFPNARKVG